LKKIIYNTFRKYDLKGDGLMDFDIKVDMKCMTALFLTLIFAASTIAYDLETAIMAELYGVVITALIIDIMFSKIALSKYDMEKEVKTYFFLSHIFCSVINFLMLLYSITKPTLVVSSSNDSVVIFLALLTCVVLYASPFMINYYFGILFGILMKKSKTVLACLLNSAGCVITISVSIFILCCN